MQQENETERENDARIRTVKLDQLCLDPNNFRFLDQQKGTRTDQPEQIPDQKVAQSAVQARTRRLILGEKDTENVRDLMESLLKNGWLPVDQIQVRPLPNKKYLVVEGNRRVATLQELKRRIEENRVEPGNLDVSLFEKIPVVLWTDSDDTHHLLLMGLKHITGNKRWKAINQAELLRTLSKKGMAPDDICRALGMQRRELGIYLQTLGLCDLYKASDYGDQFESEMFNLFREIVRAPALRKFIGWDEQTSTATRGENCLRLFSWMSKALVSDDEDDDSDGESRFRERAIATPSNLRELAKLVEDENALQLLDSTRSLSQASRRSSVLASSQLQTNLKELPNVIQDIFRLSSYLRDEDDSTLEQAIRQLKAIQSSRLSHGQVTEFAPEPTPFNTHRSSHFSEVTFQRYRGLQGVSLTGLGRINLLAGPNNTGKTSILEGIGLLTRQSDITALLETLKRRARLDGLLDPHWLMGHLPERFEISGHFDTIQASEAQVRLERSVDEGDQEARADYLATLELFASYGGQTQTSTTRFYAARDRITHARTNKILCPAVFSSPFMLAEREQLKKANKRAYELKLNDDLLSLLRERLDPGLQDIQLMESGSRAGLQVPIQFNVQHETRPTLDLHDYGEGLQRLYHLGLLASLAENGILLIDELENALHTQLLCHATRFLFDLAQRLNLQIFITTHSRECIDAFLQDPEVMTHTVGYRLTRNEEQLSARRLPGRLLRDLSEDIDFDLRRVES